MRKVILAIIAVLLWTGTVEAARFFRARGRMAARNPAADAGPAANVPGDAKAAEPGTETESALLAAINQERTRRGLPALILDATLQASTRAHANLMARVRRMFHSAGHCENVAMGQRSVAEAVGCWMRSPGHRSNILNPRYRTTGVAAYRGQDGNLYWCQQFK